MTLKAKKPNSIYNIILGNIYLISGMSSCFAISQSWTERPSKKNNNNKQANVLWGFCWYNVYHHRKWTGCSAISRSWTEPPTPTKTTTNKQMCSGGAGGVMPIIIGSGHGNPSSKPG